MPSAKIVVGIDININPITKYNVFIIISG